MSIPFHGRSQRPASGRTVNTTHAVVRTTLLGYTAEPYICKPGAFGNKLQEGVHTNELVLVNNLVGFFVDIAICMWEKANGRCHTRKNPVPFAGGFDRCRELGCWLNRRYELSSEVLESRRDHDRRHKPLRGGWPQFHDPQGRDSHGCCDDSGWKPEKPGLGRWYGRSSKVFRSFRHYNGRYEPLRDRFRLRHDPQGGNRHGCCDDPGWKRREFGFGRRHGRSSKV